VSGDGVLASQERWRRTRLGLNGTRDKLAELAGELYQPAVRVGGLPFLALRGWLPDVPVPLQAIRIGWTADLSPVALTGRESAASGVLPFEVPGRRFARYTAAMARIDRPALFENRPSYRLLDVDLATAPHMDFGPGAYFDKLDLGEALAHELALAASGAAGLPGRDALPLRTLVGDPFDLARRSVLPAIETLTLRRDRRTGRATFLLLWRDPGKVATTGGVYGLIPSGEFQPSTGRVCDRRDDLSLWRGMVREFSEELLGEPERGRGSGELLAYDDWPFYRAMEHARAEGRVRPYCLGVGMDALTLTATVLTVTVIDDEVFDELFGAAVLVNAEGTVVGSAATGADALPFDDERVSRFLGEEPMASPAACTLHRAHLFRDSLL
jgi:hypothetical protein